MFQFYKTILNLKTRLKEQIQKKILIFFFYRMNSFATFEQPYFCCKTKLKIKCIFYRMTLFYKQNEFFLQSEIFFKRIKFYERRYKYLF